MKYTALLVSAAVFGTLVLPIVTPAQAQATTATRSQTEKPFLHPLFSDNAVLQRDRKIPVWGWTRPGTTVTVKLSEQSVATRADEAGKWTAQIGPFPAGGPHTLTVTALATPGAAAHESQTCRNLLFGDVWLCSGQSNMTWTVNSSNNAEEERASANYPNIRLMYVPRATSFTPRDTYKGVWQVCSPRTIGNFSAVGYFFGRKLHQELNVPIGLIHSSWGGTSAEAWLGEQGLSTVKDFDRQLKTVNAAVANKDVPYEQQAAQWWAKNDVGTRDTWAASATNDSAWKTMSAPGAWEGKSLSNFDGIVWFRREIEVPVEWAGHDLTIEFGRIDDRDTTFWNGVEIGSADNADVQREYKIPGAQVNAGRNIIAVRVFDSGGSGGFTSKPEQMRLERAADTFLPLAGDWKYAVSAPLDQISLAPMRLDDKNPNNVTVLYNAMIAPLTPFALKGAIWYQGENNVSRAEQYSRLLPALIADWRSRFGSGDFPFHIVQLANYQAPDEEPRNDGRPNLREAQLKTADTVKNVGIAVITDVGEEKDIHPRNKQDVGLRLALSALAKDYGRNIEYSGPVLKSATRVGNTMRLTFTHAAGGLVLQGNAERVFAIAGADKKFVWASPKIDGDTITVSAPGVEKPEAVRFGWSNNPRASLYNGAKLPASPFRTDSW
jgi:sialate O-acetylesterase